MRAAVLCAIVMTGAAGADPSTANGYARPFRLHAEECQALLDQGKQPAASCDLLAAQAAAVRDAAVAYLACTHDCADVLAALDVAIDVAQRDLDATTPIRILGETSSQASPPPETEPPPAAEPPLMPLPLAGIDRDERDCELGDDAACARVTLEPAAKRDWQTRACTLDHVANACLAIGDTARATRLLDHACKRLHDAAACHRLATFYGRSRNARTYRRLTRRYAPR